MSRRSIPRARRRSWSRSRPAPAPTPPPGVTGRRPEMTVAIVTSSDRAYLPAACCQLLSVVQHLPHREGVQLFLVCCDVDEEDLAEAGRFFSDRGIDVAMIDAQETAEQISTLDTRWPRSAYLRLHLDSLLDPGFDRLVYFDADTRVMTALEPLIYADLRGRTVGAVHDFIYYVSGNIHRRRRDLLLAHDAPYLQSGVMVFDWPATLDTRVLGRARDFLEAHPESCLEAPDQDALNAALTEDWTPLDPRWNLHELYLNFGRRYTPFIEHYTSAKPWSRQRPAIWSDATAWYRRELADTSWADFIVPQRVVDVARSRLQFLRYRYGPHLEERLDRLAPTVSARLGRHREAGDDRVLPWAPRNRQTVEDMAEALIAEANDECAPLRPPEAVVGDRSWLPTPGVAAVRSASM